MVPRRRGGEDTAFIMTRINVGDYDAWKASFDKDLPRARELAKGYRLFRNVDDPGEVFVMVEFASTDDAQEGAGRLRASGVLERFSDVYGPAVVDVAETYVR
jgi:hypothetical protein